MKNKEFYIDKDGFKLHAKMDFPAQVRKKMPVVILIHGLTGHMEEEHIKKVAETITKAEYVCLRVELYGHGKSDGAFCNHNIFEWINELCYVVDYVRNLEFTTDIYLSGHSQGGLTVMLTAALKAEQIRGIIPLSPATNIVEGCRTGSLFGVIFDTENLPDRLDFWNDGVRYVTSNYARMAKWLPLEQSVAAYKGKVLIVHGTRDKTVPVSYGIKAAEQYANALLILISEDNHCYDDHLLEVVDAVYDFLLQERTEKQEL